MCSDVTTAAARRPSSRPSRSRRSSRRSSAPSICRPTLPSSTRPAPTLSCSEVEHPRPAVAATRSEPKHGPVETLRPRPRRRVPSEPDAAILITKHPVSQAGTPPPTRPSPNDTLPGRMDPRRKAVLFVLSSAEEVVGYTKELECLRGTDCEGDVNCQQWLVYRISYVEEQLRHHGGG